MFIPSHLKMTLHYGREISKPEMAEQHWHRAQAADIQIKTI
jgi:hypothetical protein